MARSQTMPIWKRHFFWGGNSYWSPYQTIAIAITDSDTTMRMGYKRMLRANRAEKFLVCTLIVTFREYVVANEVNFYMNLFGGQEYGSWGGAIARTVPLPGYVPEAT